MNRGLTDTIERDDALVPQAKASPTIGVIALRFVTLLVTIVALAALAWSR